MDAVEVSTKPIAYTHAGPRAMCDHARNKTDEQLKALADKGGVVGAVAIGSFMAAGEEATFSDFLDTIDYMVDLIGVEHIGIGCDFTVGWTAEKCRWLFTGRNVDLEPHYQIPWPLIYPEGIKSPADFPNLTRGLLERGYSEEEVKKIMGQNFLRLFEETWS
jgi:membrane dipeptidase